MCHAVGGHAYCVDRPFTQLNMSGVQPLLLWLSRSAPADSSSWIAPTWPSLAASCSAVLLLLLRLSGCTPGPAPTLLLVFKYYAYAAFSFGTQ